MPFIYSYTSTDINLERLTAKLQLKRSNLAITKRERAFLTSHMRPNSSCKATVALLDTTRMTSGVCNSHQNTCDK